MPTHLRKKAVKPPANISLVYRRRVHIVTPSREVHALSLTTPHGVLSSKKSKQEQSNNTSPPVAVATQGEKKTTLLLHETPH